MTEATTETVEDICVARAKTAKQAIGTLSASVNLEQVAREVIEHGDSLVRSPSAIYTNAASAKAGGTCENGGAEEEEVRVSMTYVDDDENVAVNRTSGCC